MKLRWLRHQFMSGMQACSDAEAIMTTPATAGTVCWLARSIKYLQHVTLCSACSAVIGQLAGSHFCGCSSYEGTHTDGTMAG